jgi:hypothetical protein
MNWIESVTSVIFVSHNGKSRKLKAERSRDLKKGKQIFQVENLLSSETLMTIYLFW